MNITVHRSPEAGRGMSLIPEEAPMQRQNDLFMDTPVSTLPERAGSGSRIARVRAEQIARGGEPCFMTHKRHLCQDTHCEWREDCRRLVAVWKR